MLGKASLSNNHRREGRSSHAFLPRQVRRSCSRLRGEEPTNSQCRESSPGVTSVNILLYWGTLGTIFNFPNDSVHQSIFRKHSLDRRHERPCALFGSTWVKSNANSAPRLYPVRLCIQSFWLWTVFRPELPQPHPLNSGTQPLTGRAST